MPPEPRLVDWSGQDGRALPLDQPLRLEFDRPLAAPVRGGAIQLVDAQGRAVEGLRLDAAGRFLSLIPELPTLPDLSDGSLRPGTRYLLRLRGAPRLDALHTVDGGVQVGDRGVELRTLPASDEEVLLGLGGSSEPLVVLGMAPGASWQLGGRGGPPHLVLSGGVDPRSLAPARLLGPDGTELRSCALRLLWNRLDGAQLEIDFGDWTGWGRLELPPLDGLGGTPLAESQRTLRVHRVP